MRAALVAEYRKLLTTRMWWILLLLMVGYLAFVAVTVALAMTVLVPDDAPAMDPVATARSTYSLVNGIGYVFPLIIGSLAITTEFRHQTVTQSLLVQPSRSRFLAAKLAAVLPIGLAVGVAATVAVVGTAGPVLALVGDGAQVRRVLSATVALAPAWTLTAEEVPE
jgi:hypothetical protein